MWLVMVLCSFYVQRPRSLVEMSKVMDARTSHNQKLLTRQYSYFVAAAIPVMI